ncbi:CHAT domain-containing protein [Candidatus Oscillochloris fontis]|uniref:CHAT domain-containing protein n=1 Tax=Candidatus Oscillochloris fontis TaxID=2496868 RepID=UPI00101D6FB6|nr:CHAT domain-containing protein [Candidatus Oscillochloris fontis]
MPLSFSQTTDTTCPQCSHTFPYAVWLIVAAAERPDLLERIRIGTIHTLTCPQCAHTFDGIDAPLLIFQPNATPPILFSPAQHTTNEQDQQQAIELLGLIREQLGTAWHDAWLAQGVSSIPRQRLAAAIENVAPNGLPNKRDKSSKVAIWESVTIEPPASIAISSSPVLADVLDAFLNAHSWDESYRQLQAHPELLGTEAIAMLDREIIAAQAEGNIDSANFYTEHCDLLRRCHQIGQDAAFAEKMEVSVAQLQSQIAIPTVFATWLTEAQQAEQRFLQKGDSSALDVAVSVWHTILEHPDFATSQLNFRLTVLNNAGGTFLRRYWSCGQSADLDRALDLRKEALDNTLPDSPDRAMILNNLGNSLRTRYARSGQMEDLEQALVVWQQAVASTPPASSDRAVYLNNLGSGMRARYTRSGRLEDLIQALDCYEQALASTSPDSPDWVSILNNLGLGLHDRYIRSGRLEDLEQALEVWQQAVAMSPHESPDRAGYLNNLGIGMSLRYARSGRLEDLEQALDCYAQAVARTPPDSPDRAMYLSNLGNGLCGRYARSGRLKDLEQALEVYQQAVDSTTPDSPDYVRYLSNLSNGLRDRYARSGRLEDLEQALEYYAQALANTESDSPEWASILTNLGLCLCDRYARNRNMEDLEQALGFWQQAVSSTAPNAPDRAGYLNSLGIGLSYHYALSGRQEDLQQSLMYYTQAVDSTAPDSPNMPIFLTNLGKGLRDRYALSGQLNDLEQAQHAYASACERGQIVAPEVALTASQTWGRWASARAAWDEAVRAFETGLVTIEQLHRSQLRRSDQEAWLHDARGLHIQAAYALVRLGQPALRQRAVEVAEIGRARGLGETLARDRSDLSAIEQIAPQLVERYRAAASQVRSFEHADRATSPQSGPPPPTTHQDRIVQILAAREELDAVIEAIRNLPGYATFLRSPTYADIAAVAMPQTPLVYLLTTPHGSLALIVTAGADQPEVLLLDSFTQEMLDALLITREGDQVVGGYLPGQLGDHQWLTAALDTALPIFGTQIIAPLAAWLRERNAHGVTLIPTGLLSLLPLHAATYTLDGQTRCLLDEFDVAYAPSARMLATAQRENQQRHAALHLAGVGNPTRDLNYAGPELVAICELLPSAASTPFYKEDARRHALWSALPTATIAHFSCHGSFANDPLDAALYLAGGDRITLRDLVAGDTSALANLRLVVMSACQTALSDFQRVPDESIGLPGGFLQTGVPAVVGTLWSVDDLSTALLMHRFYELYLQGDSALDVRPQQPARALRLAQRWLREITYRDLQVYLEHHEALKMDAQTTSRLPWLLIEEGLLKAEIGQNQHRTERPFAPPRYWAPFAFYGVMEDNNGR